MHVQAWRNFKRMQVSACLFASLIYVGAVLHAWRVLPGAPGLKLAVTLAFPAVYFALSLVLPLTIRPLRRMLKRYVWLSFVAGFGQTLPLQQSLQRRAVGLRRPAPEVLYEEPSHPYP